MAAPSTFFVIAGAASGAIVGSFLATVAMRWGQDPSALTGRSICDRCERTLRAHELVPLASYLIQRGRCLCGRNRIAALHPLVELAAAAVGGTALYASADAAAVAGAFFGWTLLLLAVLDVRHFWLPDRLTLPLTAAGLAAATLGPPDLPARLIGAVAGYAVLEAVRRLYRRVRGRDGLGGGDPKLMAAIGAWLGWAALPGVLLGASLLGLAGAGAMMLAGRRLDAATWLPFGALLAPVAFALWAIGGGWPLPP